MLIVQRYTYVHPSLEASFYAAKVLIVLMWMDDYTLYLLYVFSTKINVETYASCFKWCFKNVKKVF